MSRSTMSLLERTGLDVWAKGINWRVKSQVVVRNATRNFKGDVGFGKKMVRLIFKHSDFGVFMMKRLGEDFLGH